MAKNRTAGEQGKRQRKDASVGQKDGRKKEGRKEGRKEVRQDERMLTPV